MHNLRASLGNWVQPVIVVLALALCAAVSNAQAFIDVSPSSLTFTTAQGSQPTNQTVSVYKRVYLWQRLRGLVCLCKFGLRLA